MKNNIKKFDRILRDKSYVQSSINKAFDNYSFIIGDTNKNEIDMHYFAISHIFKNLNFRKVFKLSEPNVENLESEVERFKGIFKYQNTNRIFYSKTDDLFGLGKFLNNSRNIFSHYIHTYNEVNLESEKNSGIKEYIKDSFELASLIVLDLLNEEDIEKQNKELICLLNSRFEIELNGFIIKDKKGLLEELLFIKVEDNFEYLNYTIEKGEYLSFLGYLFLTSIFLYKDEANLLISNNYGFKKSDLVEYKQKRELFTVLSKKKKSIDVNNENSNLVKFRDILIYLNKYPCIWTKALKDEKNFKDVKSNLSEIVYSLEQERFKFPALELGVYELNEEEKDKFIHYIAYHIYKTESTKSYRKIDISTDLSKKFKRILELSGEICNLEEEIRLAKNRRLKKELEKKKKEIEDREKKIVKLAKEGRINNYDFDASLKVEDLKNKISNGKLLDEYGRNNDRFILFACRYLAERDFFGKEAKYKAYVCKDSESNKNQILQEKENLSKKEYDNLKYHKGRLVHFIKYVDHLSTNTSWDMPFVVQNNGIQIQIKIKGINRTICLQRKLLIYFLQIALENNSENGGCIILEDYFTNYYEKSLNKYIQEIENNEFKESNYSEYIKLLPKRYVKTHRDGKIVRNNKSLESLLTQTEKDNKEYQELYERAKKDNREIEFTNKNKGKQYKLRFINKACKILFFKELYLKKVSESQSHHKGFNITKEEYNNYSKAIFLFEGNDNYKEYLRHLFKSKSYFTNKKFEKIFDKSNSLEDLYGKIKQAFKSWLDNDTKDLQAKDKYEITGYSYLSLNKEEINILYINLSHFINYLKDKDLIKVVNGKIVYDVLKNKDVLIDEYYTYKIRSKSGSSYFIKKIQTNLNANYLEDCILFEISKYYLERDSITDGVEFKSIRNLFDMNIGFEVYGPDASDFKYTLESSFSRIELLASLKAMYENDRERWNNNSLLANIPTYIKTIIKYEPGNKDISTMNKKLKESNILEIDDIYKIRSYNYVDSMKFTRIWLLLERLYLYKSDVLEIVNNRIKCENMGMNDFAEFYGPRGVRNKAMHLKLYMNKTYKEVLKDVRKIFNNIKTQTSGNESQEYNFTIEKLEKEFDKTFRGAEFYKK